VARGVIWSSFAVEGIDGQLDELRKSPDPEIWLRGVAHISRIIGERLGELLRFLRESGEPELLAEFRKVEDRCFKQERRMLPLIERSGRLRQGMRQADALAVIWAMSGTDLYNQLVSGRGWTAARYEEWLRTALVRLLLEPA
jgi:hypothetical protein